MFDAVGCWTTRGELDFRFATANIRLCVEKTHCLQFPGLFISVRRPYDTRSCRHELQDLAADPTFQRRLFVAETMDKANQRHTSFV